MYVHICLSKLAKWIWATYEDLCNVSILQKNQLLAKDRKAPLKYKGCMEVATKVLAANKVEYIDRMIF